MTDINDTKKKYVGTLVRSMQRTSESRSGSISIVSALEGKLSPEQMNRLSHISRLG
ncbi:hypothetical protein [Methanolobus profundi]|uniref:Uncharacterized protein n=1 Tax=Methanolobus profundi TaxID=487685 RepID=A0A1I4TNF0_9EURY|nr:hypothetical protein [Methanolobus profundi]SFM78288.1 hypothetical protein SAMN04488696_2364 [Methanolobus profundi]